MNGQAARRGFLIIMVLAVCSMLFFPASSLVYNNWIITNDWIISSEWGLSPPSLSVNLNTPSDGSSQTSYAVSFTYIPVVYADTFVSSSVWTNVTGSWATTQANATAISNGTVNTISYSFTSAGVYLWNVQVYNTTTYAFASSNYTLTILGGTTVSLNSPASGSSLTTYAATFTYTPLCLGSTIQNSSLWLNISGTWQSVMNNASKVNNNTVNSFSYTFAAVGTYVWNVLVYNATTGIYATSNFTLTVLNGLAVTLNSPSNGANVTSFTVDFTFTPVSYGSSIVNASLYTNVSGVWQSVDLKTSVTNNSANSFRYTFGTTGTFMWNVLVYNTTTGVFASTTFYTVIIGTSYTGIYNIHMPTGMTIDIQSGLNAHFSDYWVSTSGSTMHVTAWYVDNWFNWTIDALSIQQIYNTTTPLTVIIDGTACALGTGWTYTSGIITVGPYGTSSVAISWTYNGTVVPPIPPVTSNVTYYFRSDTHTVNNVTGYNVQLTQGTLGAYASQNLGATSGAVQYGFKVYLVTSKSALTLLTGTDPVTISLAQTSPEGYYSVSYAVSDYTMPLGLDSLKVELYMRIEGNTWLLTSQFTTDALMKKGIVASTWNFTMYCKLNIVTGDMIASAYWGNSTYASGLAGVSFVEPLAQEIDLFLLAHGQVLEALLAPYLMIAGDLFYGLGLMFISGVLYLRHKKWEVILVCLLLFGGSAGIGFLIPNLAYRLVYLVTALVITFILYRLFK